MQARQYLTAVACSETLALHMQQQPIMPKGNAAGPATGSGFLQLLGSYHDVLVTSSACQSDRGQRSALRLVLSCVGCAWYSVRPHQGLKLDPVWQHVHSRWGLMVRMLRQGVNVLSLGEGWSLAYDKIDCNCDRSLPRI